MIARRRWFRCRALKIPRRNSVCTGCGKVQQQGTRSITESHAHLEMNDLATGARFTEIKGKSDTDIGKILEFTHTTVHFHVERVKKKLGVRTRTQTAAIVVSLGYL
jgi:DNA-binding NarL/FixJ family response regulator